jgi:hypothetical protein
MAEHGCKPSMDFDIVSGDTAMFTYMLSNHIFHLTDIDHTLNPNLTEREYTDSECDAGFTATAGTLHAIAWTGGAPCNITFPDNVKGGEIFVFYFTAGVAGTNDLIFTCGNDIYRNQTHFIHEMHITFQDNLGVDRAKNVNQTPRDTSGATSSDFQTVADALKLTIASDQTDNQFGRGAYISFMFHDGDHGGYSRGWTLAYVAAKQGNGDKPTKFVFSTS